MGYETSEEEQRAYDRGYEDAAWDVNTQVEDAYQEGYDVGLHDSGESGISVQLDRLVEMLREQHYRSHNSHAMRFCVNEICQEATR